MATLYFYMFNEKNIKKIGRYTTTTNKIIMSPKKWGRPF